MRSWVWVWVWVRGGRQSGFRPGFRSFFRAICRGRAWRQRGDGGRVMRVLIVENNPQLSALWQRHIARFGHAVETAATEAAALAALEGPAFQVVVLDVMLPQGLSTALADLVACRSPQTRVILVTSGSFFSDGAILRAIPNAAALITDQTRPEDLAVLVDWHGRRGSGQGA